VLKAHGGALLGGCFVGLCMGLLAAASGGRDGGAMWAIRGKDTVTISSGMKLDDRRSPEGRGTGMLPVKAGQIDARFGDERSEPCDEVEGLEEHMGDAVAIRGFEFVPDEALCS
jgi:hypothetical protein